MWADLMALLRTLLGRENRCPACRAPIGQADDFCSPACADEWADRIAY